MANNNWGPKEEGMRLSLDQIKNAKFQECDCGGVMFSEKIMIKKISALISPTGQEIDYPMQVIVCDDCGKVPTDLNPYGLVPEKYLAKKKIK